MRRLDAGARRARRFPIRTYSGGAGGCPAGTHYMGIRPNGDVTPCPYLPVFAGNASQREPRGPLDVLGAVRRHSPPRLARGAVRGVRDERPLRGLSRQGLRDDRRSDGRRPPLHAHPREIRRVSPSRDPRPCAVPGALGSPAIEYGTESPPTIAWDDAAAARMKKIPAFVRGMVIRAVEESCRKGGLDRVTVEELERIRARMPTPKISVGGHDRDRRDTATPTRSPPVAGSACSAWSSSRSRCCPNCCGR